MKPNASDRARKMGAGVAIGIGAGTALFAATDSPVFIGVGAAIGVAIGAAFGQEEEPSPQARRLMIISFGMGVLLLVALTIIYFLLR